MHPRIGPDTSPVIERARLVEPFQQRPIVRIEQRPVYPWLRQPVQDLLRESVGRLRPSRPVRRANSSPARSHGRGRSAPAPVHCGRRSSPGCDCPANRCCPRCRTGYDPVADLTAAASALPSLGLRSPWTASMSANARRSGSSTSRFLPVLVRDSGVSVATSRVMSHFSGPGIGRSGGSSVAGPLQTCTPCMRPSDINTGSVRITRSLLGVMLTRLWLVCNDSAIAVWMSARCGLRRKNAGNRNEISQLTAHRHHGRFLAQRFHKQPVVGHASTFYRSSRADNSLPPCPNPRDVRPRSTSG